MTLCSGSCTQVAGGVAGACNCLACTWTEESTGTCLANPSLVLEHACHAQAVLYLRALCQVVCPAIQTTSVFVSPPTVHIHATFNAALPRLTILQSIDASAIAHRVRARHTNLSVVWALVYAVIEAMRIWETNLAREHASAIFVQLDVIAKKSMLANALQHGARTLEVVERMLRAWI